MKFEIGEVVEYVGENIAREEANKIMMGYWSPISYHGGKFCIVTSFSTTSFLPPGKEPPILPLVNVRAVGNINLEHLTYHFYEFELKKI